MKSGFCYWATEPLDNPEYVEFLEIFENEVGVIPQTTTAIPLRNLDLTRRMLKGWERKKSFPNRFSILTTQILRRVHETFTPEELVGVELVLQNTGSINVKSGAGKAFQSDIQPGSAKRVKNSNVVSGTIACVSGFLVNIVEKRVRLVSPTLPSPAWPDGYIVLDDKKYGTPDDLRLVMEGMIEKHMSANLNPLEPINFGNNFEYFEDCGKFGIRTANVNIESPYLALIGPSISEGNNTPIEIVKRASARGEDPFRIVSLIDDARRAGLLEQCFESAKQPDH